MKPMVACSPDLSPTLRSYEMSRRGCTDGVMPPLGVSCCSLLKNIAVLVHDFGEQRLTARFAVLTVGAADYS
jgi:hypothetical protein